MTLQDDHRELDRGAAFVDRSDRGLLELRGRDRLTWLHSFVTNAVKHLGRGEGAYAFALNGQGRILFDLNVLVREDAVWLDIARIFLAPAIKHLNKYVITEDVTIADRTADFTRFAIVGARAAEAFATMGVPHFAAMPSLGGAQANVSTTWRHESITIVRNDFCGPVGGDVYVPTAEAERFRMFATDRGGPVRAEPVGDEAVTVHRIEAGILWPGKEITDEYLPAETRQLERAVSFTKGCYLGQEVVERMRSRKVVSRLLVGLHVDSRVPPTAGTPLRAGDEKPVGIVTSSCHSIKLDRIVALGYVRAVDAAPGTLLHLPGDGPSIPARVVELPFAPIARGG